MTAEPSNTYEGDGWTLHGAQDWVPLCTNKGWVLHTVDAPVDGPGEVTGQPQKRDHRVGAVELVNRVWWWNPQNDLELRGEHERDGELACSSVVMSGATLLYSRGRRMAAEFASDQVLHHLRRLHPGLDLGLVRWRCWPHAEDDDAGT